MSSRRSSIVNSTSERGSITHRMTSASMRQSVVRSSKDRPLTSKVCLDFKTWTMLCQTTGWLAPTTTLVVPFIPVDIPVLTSPGGRFWVTGVQGTLLARQPEVGPSIIQLRWELLHLPLNYSNGHPAAP